MSFTVPFSFWGATPPVIFSLAGPAVPSFLTCAHTGTLVYAAQTAQTAQQFAIDTPIWEDYGNSEGGGWWSFPAFTNQLTDPLLMSSVNWTSIGTLVVTAAVASPDGGTTATRLFDNDVAAAAVRFQALLFNTAQEYASIWLRNVAGNPPTLPGLFEANDGQLGVNLQILTNNWQRVSYFQGLPPAGNYAVFPAGAQTGPVFTAGATGAVEAWACQTMSNGADVPFTTGATNNCTLPLSSTVYSQLIAGNGDLDFEVSFLQMYSSTNRALVDFYLFRGTSADGETSLRWNASTPNNCTWTLRVRGVDVLTSVVGLAKQNYEQTWRVQYKPSTGISRIRHKLNGCIQINSNSNADTVGVANGAPLAPFTAFYLGSNVAATPIAARHSYQIACYRNSAAVFQPTIMMLGDSIMTWTNQQGVGGVFLTPFCLPPLLLYTKPQSRTAPGIVSIANAGDTAQQQLAAAQASPYTATVGTFVIQVGFNNINASGESAPVATAHLQALLDGLRVINPSALVVFCRITPGTASAPVTAVWNIVNSNIDGTGPNPIVDSGNNIVRVSNNSINLDTGPGNGVLQVQYRVASGTDNTHPNDPGRIVMMGPIQTALIANGKL